MPIALNKVYVMQKKKTTLFCFSFEKKTILRIPMMKVFCTIIIDYWNERSLQSHQLFMGKNT